MQFIVLINYSSEPQTVNAEIKDGYIYEILKGNIEKIDPFEMTILKLKN